MLAILAGQKDKQLLDIIHELEFIRDKSLSARISERELDALALAYERLDLITQPKEER
jgi:hypothetical protein